jgi:hypothetical protein
MDATVDVSEKLITRSPVMTGSHERVAIIGPGISGLAHADVFDRWGFHTCCSSERPAQACMGAQLAAPGFSQPPVVIHIPHCDKTQPKRGR